MTPKEARHDLAADLATALGPTWTVYASPPEVITAPAVVLAPRTPYRVAGTVCNEELKLTATLLVQRAAGPAALDFLDDACTAARTAIHASSVVSWVEAINDIGIMQEAGGVDYLAAVINVTSQV
jgi:hypothetical protein